MREPRAVPPRPAVRRSIRDGLRVLLLAALWRPAASLAQAATRAEERRVKAAFLFRFLDYVEWPERAFGGPGDPVVIGIVEAPDIVAELAPVAQGHTVRGRPMVVRALRSGESTEGAHLLFVDASERARLREHGAAARERGMLLVTEVEEGLSHGATINLLRIDSRIRFEVSLPAAERAGLRLSSRLLGVAHRVVPAS